MKGQWGLIVGLIVALLIAIFAVINMDVVQVNYAFGTADLPLVIVIISSVLMGGILVGMVGLYGIYKLRFQVKKLKKENNRLRSENETIMQEKESYEVVSNEIENNTEENSNT